MPGNPVGARAQVPGGATTYDLVGAPTEPATVLSTPNRGLRKLGWYVLLTAMSLVVVFPIYLVLLRALAHPSSYALDRGVSFVPKDADWGVFVDAWRDGGLGRAMLRSATVTVFVTAAQVVTAVLAAYAFVFLNFPLKRVLFALCMGSMLLPIEVTLLSNVQTMRDLHWMNSLQALVLPFAAAGFGIFLVRQAFSGIPEEIRDAARLDGYGHLSFLLKFAIPLTRPLIGAFVLVAGLAAWGQYIWHRAVILDEDKETAQIALRSLAEIPDQANRAPAGALILMVPVVVLLVLFQRQIIRGLTAGAVKG